MKRKLLLCWVFVAAVGGCTSPKVGYDFDRGVDFSAYHTYAWVPGAQEATRDRRLDSSLIDSRIRAAIDAQLRSKGYSSTADVKPQFLVAYHVGMKVWEDIEKRWNNPPAEDIEQYGPRTKSGKDKLFEVR